MSALHNMTSKLLVLDEKQVHWFPRHISELDHVANRTLEAGTDLESDHPGFNDPTYRSRRAKLAEAAAMQPQPELQAQVVRARTMLVGQPLQQRPQGHRLRLALHQPGIQA